VFLKSEVPGQPAAAANNVGPATKTN
jgi:hypothetical protein